MPNPAAFFHVPYVQGNVYAPGPQPKSPGESHLPWAGHMGLQYNPLPWPGAVPVLNLWASNPGTPRERAPVPVVNRPAPLPTEFFYMKDFVGKSQG